MDSKQATANMGHRHSLTIETNPLHLLPSNIRRFSQADSSSQATPPPIQKFNKKQTERIPENDTEKKEDTAVGK